MSNRPETSKTSESGTDATASGGAGKAGEDRTAGERSRAASSGAGEAGEDRTAGERSGAAHWRRLAAGVAPAVVLLVVAIWEIGAAARAGHDVPDDAAWQAASAAVRERYRPDELIVFAPSWVDPVGRMHLGDLMSVDMASRMDDARYGVVWELGIRGARAPERHGRTLTWSTEIRGIVVRRLEAPAAVVVTDFVAAFRQTPQVKGQQQKTRPHRALQVTIEGPAAARPVVSLEEVGFAPRRCVRVEPRPNGTVRIRYQGVALGSSLVGYMGLADVFTRRDIRDPGRLEVFVNGHEVAEVTAGVDDGWVRFEAATTPGEHADVVFAATAVGPRAMRRLICIAAEARQ